MGKKRNTYRVLVRKPEGNRPQGRPGHRQMDNVTGWEGTDCIYPTQDRNTFLLLLQGTVFLETEDCEGVTLCSGRTVHTAQCDHCVLTHTTYEVQRMVWFSTYHSQ
jgi:hypothetical protein